MIQHPYKRREHVASETESCKAAIVMSFNAPAFEAQQLDGSLTPEVMRAIQIQQNPDLVELVVTSSEGTPKAIALTTEEFMQLWRLLGRLHRDGVFDQEVWHAHPRMIR